MADIELNTKTFIAISSHGFNLFPNDNLYPDDDLFPSGYEVRNDGIIDTIVAGSTSYEEMLVEQNPLFGKLYASKFECMVYNTSDLSGKYMTVYQVNNGSYMPIFSGIIDSCKCDRLGTDRTLVAYDPSYTIRTKDVSSWWTSFWSNRTQATLKQVRDSLCDYVLSPLNILFEEVELPNDDIIVHKNVELSQASFGDILNMVCELNCCFPHFNRLGELEFLVLNTEDTPIDLRNRYEVENSTFEEYTTVPMTGVQFFDSEGELKLSIGDNDNSYQISQNIFTYDMDTSTLTSIADTIIDYLSELTYTPASVKMVVSDQSINLGDYVQTDRGNFYVFTNNCEGSLLIDQTLGASGDEHPGQETQDINFESVVLREKIASVKHDVESFEIDYRDFKTQTASNFTQTSEQISAEVTRATTAEGTLSTRVQANADGLSTKVSKNNVISEINQSAEAVSINANKVNLTGYVTATDLSTEGQTTINGANITTGSISCDRLNGGTIKGQNISGGTITTEGTSELGGHEVTLQGGKIMTSSSSTRITSMSMTYEPLIKVTNTMDAYSTSIGAGVIQCNGRITCENSTSDYQYKAFDSARVCHAYGPSHNYSLYWTGSQLQVIIDDSWFNIAISAASDKRLKKNIDILNNSYIEAIGKVEIKQFNLNMGELVDDSILNFGILAQDVVETLEEEGLTENGLQMISKGRKFEDDPTEYYTIDYEQFLLGRIAYDEKLIAEQQKEIDSLKSMVSDLADRLSKLENKEENVNE